MEERSKTNGKRKKNRMPLDAGSDAALESEEGRKRKRREEKRGREERKEYRCESVRTISASQARCCVSPRRSLALALDVRYIFECEKNEDAYDCNFENEPSDHGSIILHMRLQQMSQVSIGALRGSAAYLDGRATGVVQLVAVKLTHRHSGESLRYRIDIIKPFERERERDRKKPCQRERDKNVSCKLH